MRICGCDLAFEDIIILIERLDDDPTIVSGEAAAAFRYAFGAALAPDPLDRDFRDAISQVLHEPLPPGLVALRDAIRDGCC